MNTPKISDLDKLNIPESEERTPEEAVRELIEWYDMHYSCWKDISRTPEL